MPPAIPLVAFVNSKSGGQQGIKVLEKLKKYIDPDHIFDLSEGGPAPGLSKFKGSRFRILVCGGDGTAGWILAEIEKMKFPEELIPPVAILPIGTGNDLARTLKWGGGYTGRGLGKAIQQVDKACVVLMDKWRVTCTSDGDQAAPPTSMYLYNYISIGSDADVALKFHEMRKAHPEKFTSRTQNKAVYVRLGLSNIIPESLRERLVLEIDGTEIPLTEKTRCVLVMNVTSYSGGGDPWGPHKAKHARRGLVSPAIDDGLVEVVGLTGPLNIAAMHANVARGKKLGQGKDIKMTLKKAIPAQVDGEPWSQPPGVITVQYAGKSIMLANSPPTHHLPLSPTLAPTSTPSSPVGSPAGPRVLERSRSTSMPNTAEITSPPRSPSPLQYGPVDPEKRKKNRLYCDACGLEFFLPHMLANHGTSGLCSGGASSSSKAGASVVKTDSFAQ